MGKGMVNKLKIEGWNESLTIYEDDSKWIVLNNNVCIFIQYTEN